MSIATTIACVQKAITIMVPMIMYSTLIPVFCNEKSITTSNYSENKSPR